MKRLEIVHIRLYGPLPESLIRDIQESVADEGDQVSSPKTRTDRNY